MTAAEEKTLFRGEIVRRADLAPIGWHESRIAKCYLHFRENDGDGPVIFGDIPGRVRIDLVGYAIVPMETWNKLAELAERAAGDEAKAMLETLRSKRAPAAPGAWIRLRKALARWIGGKEA